MAPLELMPHTVNYFMDAIKSQVWDNTVFSHVSDHVLFAQPQDPEGNDKHQNFEENNISKLSFPEYSDEYPHEKYTLGLSGRPGGPEFYINTGDNTIAHGPGGQSHHAIYEEADACFGKIIQGHDVVDWMQEGGNDIGKEHPSTTYTVIKSIRIIA